MSDPQLATEDSRKHIKWLMIEDICDFEAFWMFLKQYAGLSYHFKRIYAAKNISLTPKIAPETKKQCI